MKEETSEPLLACSADAHPNDFGNNPATDVEASGTTPIMRRRTVSLFRKFILKVDRFLRREDPHPPCPSPSLAPHSHGRDVKLPSLPPPPLPEGHDPFEQQIMFEPINGMMFEPGEGHAILDSGCTRDLVSPHLLAANLVGYRPFSTPVRMFTTVSNTNVLCIGEVDMRWAFNDPRADGLRAPERAVTSTFLVLEENQSAFDFIIGKQTLINHGIILPPRVPNNDPSHSLRLQRGFDTVYPLVPAPPVTAPDLAAAEEAQKVKREKERALEAQGK